MYLNHYPQRHTERELTIDDGPLYGMTDADGMLESIVEGRANSCAIEDAQRVLKILEDGEALDALGFTDADQVWIETLHADIKAELSNANRDAQRQPLNKKAAMQVGAAS
jgi:hypothetical protein